MASPNHWTVGGVDFGPNTACLILRVTFGKEICHHKKWDQITQVHESAGSAVGDISIQQGDQRGERVKKIL